MTKKEILKRGFGSTRLHYRKSKIFWVSNMYMKETQKNLEKIVYFGKKFFWGENMLSQSGNFGQKKHFFHFFFFQKQF